MAEKMTQAERLSRLELWRNGNGARGAEERLQCMEADMRKIDQKFNRLTILIVVMIAVTVPELVFKIVGLFA